MWYCFLIHYLQKLFCYLCHPLIYYMWNITTLFMSFDKWLVELYRTNDFPNLLSLKIKLRKDYPDSLILVILDLYLWFFCAIKCSIKQRKAHVGLWNKKRGLLYKGSNCSKGREDKKHGKINNQPRQASAKSLVCECLKKKKLYDILEQINEPLCDCFLICTMQIIPTLTGYC